MARPKNRRSEPDDEPATASTVAARATGRRTQRERSAETERRLIDAATALIARHGSRDVSVAEVGAAAGYSRGIVTHHFGSKERLLHAVVTSAQQIETPHSDGDGLDQLATMIEAYTRSLATRPEPAAAFLQLWAEAVASDPKLRPLFDERDHWFRNELEALVREGQRDGSIDQQCEPVSTAIMLVGLLRGVGMQLISTARKESVDLLSQAMVTFVRRALQATC